MTVLGLDLSSVNSGYSVMGPQPAKGVVEYGDAIHIYKSTVCGIGDESEPALIDYGSIIPNKKMNHAQKLQYIYEEIYKILEQYPQVDKVIMEDQHFRNNASTLKLLARISGVAMLAAQQHGCEIVLYPAATVKKGFTGNGRAEKKDMIATANDRFGLELKDDNQADAIGVSYTYFNEQRKETP
jgi:Holliday junction resolvasome RuvABC endonuclease subunit